MDDLRLICIRVYSSPQDAQLSASFLRDHGIKCSVDGDQIAVVLSWYGLAVRKVQLLVHETNTLAACRLLEEIDAEHDSRRIQKSETGVELDWVCVSCDENNADTFDECWSCGQPMPEKPERRVAESDQTAVAIERLSSDVGSDSSSPYRPPMVELSRVGLTPQHELVPRIIRSTIFSLWFPPLSFYTIYLLSAVFQQGEPPRRVYAAMILTGLVAIGTLLFPAAAILRS